MKIHRLDQQNSLINNYIAQMRDINTQSNQPNFRRNIERIGMLMAYEISKTLTYNKTTVQTPLASCEIEVGSDNIVLSTILRAGMPFHQGFLNVFDQVENAFIAAFRDYNEKHTDFKIVTEYLASPSIADKTLIVLDPMIATGASMLTALDVLKERGVPKKTILAGLIASEEALQFLEKSLPEEIELWVAVVDPILDENKYIVPGLGDAGDLCFGGKI